MTYAIKVLKCLLIQDDIVLFNISNITNVKINIFRGDKNVSIWVL